MDNISYVIESRLGLKVVDHPGQYDTVLLEICRSDTGDGGWSLHAPGSEEVLSSGEAKRYALVDRWDRPDHQDIASALIKIKAAE